MFEQVPGQDSNALRLMEELSPSFIFLKQAGLKDNSAVALFEFVKQELSLSDLKNQCF